MKKKSLIAVAAALMVMLGTVMVSADAGDFKLVSSYPEDGQKNTSIENVGVKLRFNRSLSGDAAQKNNENCVKIVDKKGKEIPIKVMASKNEEGLLLVLGDNNDENFNVENNAEYELIISGDLMDDNGDRLGKDTTITFQTFNQQLNTMINMGMMIIIFGGITVMTIRNANQARDDKEKKTDKNASASFNPYHEAKKSGKTVEEVIEEHKKQEEKAAKKKSKKNKEESDYVKDYQLKLSEILPNVYSVAAPKPISAAGGKYKSSRGLASNKSDKGTK